MTVKIRLSRGGVKNRPYYRIVVADVRCPRDGRFIEHIGAYDPIKPKDSQDRIKFKETRVQYWLSVGAKPTERVSRLMMKNEILNKHLIKKST